MPVRPWHLRTLLLKACFQPQNDRELFELTCSIIYLAWSDHRPTAQTPHSRDHPASLRYYFFFSRARIDTHQSTPTPMKNIPNPPKKKPNWVNCSISSSISLWVCEPCYLLPERPAAGPLKSGSRDFKRADLFALRWRLLYDLFFLRHFYRHLQIRTENNIS